MTLEEMKNDIVAELQDELLEDGNTLDDVGLRLLTSKVRGAIREVKAARRYPSSYTAIMICADMERFYDNVKNIALYDFNHVGIEFQTGSSENGISRTFESRSKMFNGIIPLGVIA